MYVLYQTQIDAAMQGSEKSPDSDEDVSGEQGARTAIGADRTAAGDGEGEDDSDAESFHSLQEHRGTQEKGQGAPSAHAQGAKAPQSDPPDSGNVPHNRILESATILVDEDASDDEVVEVVEPKKELEAAQRALPRSMQEGYQWTPGATGTASCHSQFL